MGFNMTTFNQVIAKAYFKEISFAYLSRKVFPQFNFALFSQEIWPVYYIGYISGIIGV